jgi:hypothetical protein
MQKNTDTTRRRGMLSADRAKTAAAQNYAMASATELTDDDNMEEDACESEKDVWPPSPTTYPVQLDPDYFNRDRFQWEYGAPDPHSNIFGDRMLPIPMPQSPTSPPGCGDITGDDLDAMGLFSKTDAWQLHLDLRDSSAPIKQRQAATLVPHVEIRKAPNVRVYIADQEPEEYNDVRRNVSVLTREVFLQNGASSVNSGILLVCTLNGPGNGPYTVCGAERMNWAVQMLINATEGLQYAACVYQQQQCGHAVQTHDWKNATLYENAVAAGRLFLRLPDYPPNYAVAQPHHFFSPGMGHNKQLEGYREHLALNTHTRGMEEPQNTVEYSKKTAHDNTICAQVSIYFLMHIVPLLFATDPHATKLYNSSKIHEKLSQNLLTSTIQHCTESVMVEIDKIAQFYNETVAKHCTSSSAYVFSSHKVQIVKAPRPWVIMQVIQMRLYTKPTMLNRCVFSHMPCL